MNIPCRKESIGAETPRKRVQVGGNSVLEIRAPEAVRRPQTPRRRLPIAMGLAGLSLTLAVSGCCSTKKCQLERVAKDWCMTIRASQVIPVYPLTEDLQPGDIFLVQVPIDQQQRVYDEKGFLPLDNHLARLNPGGYPEFYRNSFLAGNNHPLLPRDWAHPLNTNYWIPAPRAAFPSYSFSVRRGAGLNLAVPVQGVPVGLSLLGSDAVDGTVTIKQARTMGVDTLSLWREIQAWARTNAAFLSGYGARPGDRATNYLRVVTRVYATGQMDVNLRDASSRSAGADAGVPKPVNLLFPELPQGGATTSENVARNYTNGWNLLNEMIQKATATDAAGKFLPGGSLRLAAASSRSVTLQEEFNPPLILGYLGFDCVIDDDGTLGPPVPTHAMIDRTAKVQQAKVKQFHSDVNDQIKAYNAVAARYRNSPALQERIRELARQVNLSAEGSGSEWLIDLGALVDGNDPQKTERFNRLKALVDAL